MNTAKKLSGAAIAATAAVMLMSGSVVSAGEAPAVKAQVHCLGVNSCKGTSGCATANNACKGQNSCKGQGWLAMSKAECAEKGGTEG